MTYEIIDFYETFDIIISWIFGNHSVAYCQFDQSISKFRFFLSIHQGNHLFIVAVVVRGRLLSLWLGIWTFIVCSLGKIKRVLFVTIIANNNATTATTSFWDKIGSSLYMMTLMQMTMLSVVMMMMMTTTTTTGKHNQLLKKNCD